LQLVRNPQARFTQVATMLLGELSRRDPQVRGKLRAEGFDILRA